MEISEDPFPRHHVSVSVCACMCTEMYTYNASAADADAHSQGEGMRWFGGGLFWCRVGDAIIRRKKTYFSKRVRLE